MVCDYSLAVLEAACIVQQGFTVRLTWIDGTVHTDHTFEYIPPSTTVSALIPHLIILSHRDHADAMLTPAATHLFLHENLSKLQDC
jgi:hypothetical protein